MAASVACVLQAVLRSPAVPMLCALAALAACSSVRQTAPPRAATEQLLISTAGDRAAERLALQLPPGKKVFVDPTNFEGLDGKYVLSCVRDRILHIGGQLVNDKDKADIIVEARAGALSIDEEKFLLGIPAFEFPIPLAGPIKTPELALYKRAVQQGVAKLGITAFDAKEGTLIGSAGPEFGYSHRKEWVVLLMFGWTEQDVRPTDDPNNHTDIE